MIKKVKSLTNKEYYARGMTALLDTIGRTINHIAARHRNALESEIPAKTIVVITTDGYENASHEFDSVKVKAMIENQKKECGWEFLFLVANIDAVETAKNFAITKEFAVTYEADEDGTALDFESVSNVVSDVRASRPMAANWKEKIETHLKSKKH